MPEIARSDDLRRNNQRRILHALRRHGPMSRTEISGATGLSASTVTAITAAFLDSGVLIEASTPDSTLSRRGRPQVTLTLNPTTACIAALACPSTLGWSIPARPAQLVHLRVVEVEPAPAASCRAARCATRRPVLRQLSKHSSVVPAGG